MHDTHDTLVMLFHNRDDAERFCSELEARNFDRSACEIIGPDDLPLYGRGEHAVLDRPATGGLMDKLSSFFGFDDADRSKYTDLSSCLEAKGLSKSDADYYEQEVRSGSTMLLVKAGDRIDEVRSLAGQGISPGSDIGVDTSYRSAGTITPGMTPDVGDAYGKRDRDVAFGGKERLELREEVPEIERHEAQAGEAQIGKRIVTEHETIDVPKRREELVIERHPVEGREPATGDLDVSRDETVTVPLMEEDVTVEKRPVVSEEVEIGKRDVTETEREDITLRREELEVDKDTGIADRDRDYFDRERRDRPAA